MELACGKTSSPCKKKFLATVEIEDGDSEHAIKIVIRVVNTGFELLPQHLLFAGAVLGAVWAQTEVRKNKKPNSPVERINRRALQGRCHYNEAGLAEV